MASFRHTNLFPGQCTQCQKLVPKGAGTARNEFGLWQVTHKDCFASIKRLNDRPATRRAPLATLKLQLLGIPDYPEKHRYGEELGLFEPLQVATDACDIAFHLASVIIMAQQFRVAE